MINNNILPTQCRDFMTKSYWEKFFKKIKKQGLENEYFEWYGDYSSFEHLFKQFIKIDQKLIHIGSGKSLLAEQLYDNGICKDILNVDFEKESLAHMSQRSQNTRPEMKFECFSLLEHLPLEDNQFDIILDKGTLDAIYPPNLKNIDQIQEFFSNIGRILKPNGYYILISLLQDYLWETVLQKFANWDIVVFETVIQKSKLYPFFVILKKPQINEEESKAQNQKKILLRLLDQSLHSLTHLQAKDKVKRIQLQNHFITQVYKLRQGQNFTLDLWSPNNKQTPRYTLFIYDNDNPTILLKKTCGIFIIPQGRELIFLFGTPQGHRELISQVGMSRLIIARLNPGHTFESLKSIQDELSNAMKDLTPKGCKNAPCPFMTDGDEIGG